MAYNGEKSGKTYTTADGNEYQWLLSEEQVEFNIKTTDKSNFESFFRIIWVGNYVVEDEILKNYSHSHAVWDYRETYLTKQPSGKTGYSYGWAVEFASPVENQFRTTPEQANDRLHYKYNTGNGTFGDSLAKWPTSTNRSEAIKNYSWSNRIEDGWWNDSSLGPNTESVRSTSPPVNQYLRSDLITSSTWSDTVRINLDKTGSTSDSVIQAKQVDKSEYDSGFVGSIVTGTSDDDIIRGLAGFDQLTGKAGDDLIHGGNGRDIIDGGSGSDELHGDFGWNTYKDQQDGSKDLIAIKSDQHLSNFWYGKAGNSPNGEKADFIEGLDAIDEIKIIGVSTSDITVADNVSARGVTGIGIYAKGTLEAVYSGGDLSIGQITQMTSGDGSTAAMNNQMWSYWGDNSVPALLA